jgi:hypothetical protein
LKRMIMHPPAPNYDLQLPASWGEHGSQTSQDRANCWNPTKVDRTGGKVRLHTVLWKRRQSICTFRIQFWIENRNCDNSCKNGVTILVKMVCEFVAHTELSVALSFVQLAQEKV